MTDLMREAQARADAREAREAARPPIDYAAMRREFPKQKAALTRALNSKDADKVLKACTDAVRAWNRWGAWPDAWSRWQRALDDTLGWRNMIRLEDLT